MPVKHWKVNGIFILLSNINFEFEPTKQGNWKMSPGKVLQPAVNMKVKELFWYWFSQPVTQLTLNDRLRRIKNKEKTEFGNTDSRNSKNKSFTSKNSNSKQCILGDTILPLSLSPPQPSTTLPLATPASSRNISNVRATRRSSGTKEVSLFLIRFICLNGTDFCVCGIGRLCK